MMNKRSFSFKISFISIIVSLSASSRIVLTIIPNVSLTTPLTILGGMIIGVSGGFLIGFMSMFISDIYIGFGPWTPMTSLSMGLVGGISGLLGRFNDRILLFLFSYLLTLLYDILSSILTMTIYFGIPPSIAIINLFIPVFIGGIPYPMGLIHELSTALIVVSIYKPLCSLPHIKVVGSG